MRINFLECGLFIQDCDILSAIDILKKNGVLGKTMIMCEGKINNKDVWINEPLTDIRKLVW